MTKTIVNAHKEHPNSLAPLLVLQSVFLLVYREYDNGGSMKKHP